MKKIKELTSEDQQKVLGGNGPTCAISVGLGAATGGAMGAIGGAMQGCVTYGNKKDWRTPTYKDPHYKP